eukprot:5677374-Ditylum_brightwellii.AAC.1
MRLASTYMLYGVCTGVPSACMTHLWIESVKAGENTTDSAMGAGRTCVTTKGVDTGYKEQLFNDEAKYLSNTWMQLALPEGSSSIIIPEKDVIIW